MLYSEILQKRSTEIKQAAAVHEAAKKITKLTRFFSVAGADVEDNVTLTPQSLNPDNDNSNLICAAEFASE